MSELKIVKSDVKVYSININNGFQSGGVLSTLLTLRVNFFTAFLGFFGYCTLSGHWEKIDENELHEGASTPLLPPAPLPYLPLPLLFPYGSPPLASPVLPRCLFFSNHFFFLPPFPRLLFPVFHRLEPRTPPTSPTAFSFGGEPERKSRRLVAP